MATEAPIEKVAEAPAFGARFSQAVMDELAKPLDWGRVKKKPGSGNFDYIPHADVRRTANAIFGYDGWGYTTDSVQIVTQVPLVSRDGKEGVQACAVSTVTLKIKLDDGTWLEKGGTGEGTGNGYGPTAAVEAPGKAAKEAESDALKRAFINLGDQFGLILYAKDEERNTLQAEAEARQPKTLPDGDKPATDEEVNEFKRIAAGVSAEAADKAIRAVTAHRAKMETNGFGPIVSAKWLSSSTQALLKSTMPNGGETTFKAPEGVETTPQADITDPGGDAVAAAFDEAA